MKKATLFLSALMLISYTSEVLAQKISNPFSSAEKYTSFGVMASIPVGKFSSDDLNDGGFANTGWGVYFDSKTTLKSGLTFISHSTYSSMRLKQNELAATFTRELGRKTTILGGKHMPFLTTLGLGYDFRPTKFISWGITVQAGLLYNSFKAFDLTVYDTDNKTVLFRDNLKYDSQFTFAYVFGAHAGCSLIKDLLDLQIFADYSASKFNSTLRGSEIGNIKTSQQIQIVNAGVGLVVHTKK